MITRKLYAGNKCTHLLLLRCVYILDINTGSVYHANGMTILIFIKDFLIATLGQLVSLFLGIFIFGLLIQCISQMSFKSLANAFGVGGTYIVAWLGTPIHELGHAFFCLIFGHKISDIRFFKPDQNTGTLGYVYHKWNPKNPWHVTGNFFIGIGPMILGSAVLFTLFYFLIPGSAGIWESISSGVKAAGEAPSFMSYLSVFKDSALAILNIIFMSSKPELWQFWIFLYLSICIASNVRLSWADIKSSLSGLGCIIIPVFILNLVLMLVGKDSGIFLPYTASVLGIIYSLLIFSLVMALIGFLFIYVISAVFYWLRYRSLLNPIKNR